MALQKASKANNAVGFKFTKAGDTLKGYYQGQVTKTINGSPAVEHTYKTKDGLLSLLGQAHILNQIKNNGIEPGTYVEISFTGNAQKLKGGRTMKVYDVAFDRDDTDSSEAPSQEAEQEYGDDGVDDESENEEETVAYAPPTPAKTPAAAPSAERQARVKDLLKGRSSQS
jgi:hypothetical protein